MTRRILSLTGLVLTLCLASPPLGFAGKTGVGQKRKADCLAADYSAETDESAESTDAEDETPSKSFNLDENVSVQNGNLEQINALLTLHEIEFKNAISIRPIHYSISDPFPIDQSQRVAVLFVVETEAGKFLRAAYRSNSQGTFRVLPAMNCSSLVFPDGGKLPGFDKGLIETSLDLPPAVQEVLSARLNSVRNNITWPQGLQILRTVVRLNTSAEDWKHYFFQMKVEFEEVALLKEAEKVISTSEVEFLNQEDKPDFSKINGTYTTYSSTAGDVVARQYPSFNGAIAYTIYEAAPTTSHGSKRIWIASASCVRSKINSWGVYSDFVKMGPLAAPLWEYTNQIEVTLRKGRSHPQLPVYSFNWATVKRAEVVVEWYEAQHLSLPATLESSTELSQTPTQETQPFEDL